jgi:chromosome segregation ATPase
MPEQAILDLPVLQFDLYADSPGRMHARCIECYGLAGFRPHHDAVFHFAASLWRYRHEESLKQVALLSACYLHALSRHVAARRRVAAVRAALDEGGEPALRQRLQETDDELAAAQEDLDDIGRQVLELVFSFTELKARESADARAVEERNLAMMGRDGWIDRLERLARDAGAIDLARIDWTAPLAEVMQDLEGIELPEGKNGNGGHVDPGLLSNLETELREYRSIANQASQRLRQVDSERHELERLLHQTEQGYTDRSLALEEARHALEVTLAEVRERIGRMERNDGADLQTAQRRIEELTAERDRLAAELLAALDTTTDAQSSHEELVERLEQASGDRLEASQALSALSRRLEEIQSEAEGAAERSDSMHARVRELEDMVSELRAELSRAEQRHAQAVATIDALESTAGRTSEFEAILTESEERLADTQERLAEAELRIDALTGQLEDRDYELKKAQDRVEAQKRTIDSVSVQLAEAETLTDEHDARILALERENERLRRDLSDAQSRMLDAKGDVDEAREAAESARAELERTKQRLNEERGKSSQVTNESVELRRALRERDEEIARVKPELLDLQARLDRANQAAQEQTARAADARKDADEKVALARQKQDEVDRLRSELTGARQEADGSRAEAERLARETTATRAELERATAELEALRTSAGMSGGRLSELRAAGVEQEQQIAALREELQAARDLAIDRQRKLEEKAELANERATGAARENETLIELLEQGEKARASERAEFEALIEAERGRDAGLQAVNAELQELRAKLHESEAFLIKRQREFEKTEARLNSLLEEVRAIADLRAKYEKMEPGNKRDEVASQIGRRMDSVFAAAGKPVHADRRTEKLVIMTVKKSEEELAAESDKPFVATNKDDDSNAETDV